MCSEGGHLAVNPDLRKRVHFTKAYHSVGYYTDSLVGAVHHEMGHILHDQYPSLELDTRDVLAGVGKHVCSVTERAKDGIKECIAENFALITAGVKDLVHPIMVELINRYKK
jgi:hypothetical protein